MKLIKAAGINDMPIIHNLAHEIWPSAYGDILSPAQLKYMLNQFYSLSSLQKQVADLQHNFLIVSDEDFPVGFASFSPKEKDSSTYRLHRIYILPQQQGTGTGKLLLNHIINTIKKSEATALELNVNRHNKARSFYEKYGFTITGREDIDIGAGYFMNDYVMKLALK
jgi:ribosomal protein S18 acetylase RimI-like enzyme